MLTSLSTVAISIYLSFFINLILGDFLFNIVLGVRLKNIMRLRETSAFCLGLIFVFLLDSLFSRFIGGVSTLDLIVSRVLIFVLPIYLFYKWKRRDFYELKKYLITSLLSLIVVLWLFLIPILEDAKRNIIFGLTSLGNNDLPLSAQLSMHNLLYGYHGDSLISPIVGTISAGNYLSKFTYIGTISSTDFFAKLFGYNVIQATSLVLIFSTGFVFIALKNLGISLGLRGKKAYLVGIVGVFLPTSLYSTSMGFIGAEFGTAALIILITGSLDYSASRVSRIEFIFTSVLGLAVILFTYSQIALPAFIGLLFIQLISTFFRSGERSFLTVIRSYVLVVFISILLCFNALPNMITLTKWLTGKQFGWKLQLFDPLSTFISVSELSIPHSRYLLLLWIPILIAILVLVRRITCAGKRYHESLIVLSFLIAPGIFAIRYGWDGYQTWKLITYILPAACVIIFSLFRRHEFLLTIVSFYLVFQPLILWSSVLNHSAPQVTNRELFEVSQYINGQHIDSVNVKVGDFWYSMLVGSLLTQNKVAMNSLTYAPVSEISSTCTIVDRNSPLYSSNLVDFKNSLYAVVKSPSACK